MMKMIWLTLLIFTSQALASSGGHGENHGVPKEVLYQALNIAIFIGILVYFLKDKVRTFFAGRYEDFTRMAREAEQNRKNLEFKIADIIRRAQVLDQTSQKSLADAQKDAEKMLSTRIEEAKSAAARLEKEVASQINDDQTKLIEKLRNEALEMSVVAAEQQLTSAGAEEKAKITKQFQQRVEGATI